MNKKEREACKNRTISRWNRCQEAKKIKLKLGESEEIAHREAICIWNEWANELIDEKKKLKENGLWYDNRNEWNKKATTDFSNTVFYSDLDYCTTHILHKFSGEEIYKKNNILNKKDKEKYIT